MGKAVFSAETTYTAEFQAELNTGKERRNWSHTLKFTTGNPLRAPPDQVKELVKRINHYRRLAKLNEVTLDETLSKPCQAHAIYLSRNEGRPNLNPNTEDSALPGYTAEGKAIAPRANMGLTSFDPPSTIDRWAAMFHYRFPILDPLATRVGVGITRSPQSWYLVLVNEQNGGSFTSPVVFPAPDQTDVPIYYAVGEGPSPIPDKDRVAGFPVFVQFPERASVKDVVAEVYKEGDSQPLSAYVYTPEKFLINPGYQKNSIHVIPKSPLQINTRYEARFKARVDGQTWEKKWTFRTQGDDLDSQRDLALTSVAELNRQRKSLGLLPVTLQEDLSPGCLAHARYISMNWGHKSLEGLGMHDEVSTLPGYSPEGRLAGKESVIAMGSPPASSIEAWINTFYHRIPLLEPDLASVGVGFAQGSNPAWFVVLITSSDRCKERIVAYPPHGSTDAAKDNPITFTVYSPTQAQQANLKLLDDTGVEVPCDVRLPAQLKMSGNEANTVAVIPRSPLKSGVRYTVKGKLQGGNRTWAITNSFQTGR